MARRYVPQTYSTIAAAVAASSSGDIVVIDTGDYYENIDSAANTENLTFRAAYGATVYLRGAVTLQTGWVFKGITLWPQSTSATLVGDGAAKVAHFRDCTFDLTSFPSSYIYNASLYTGSTMRRCLFKGVARVFYSVAETTAIDVEACVFAGVAASSRNFVAYAPYSSFRHCVFVGCSANFRILTARTATNCIFKDCTSGTIGVIASGGAGDTNCFHGNTGTLRSGTWARNLDADPKFVVDYHGYAARGGLRLQPTSPCIAAGTPNTSYALGLDRMSFSETAPSIGVHEWARPRSCVQTHYALLKLGGFAVALGTGTGTPGEVTPAAARSYAGGYEVARELDNMAGDALGHKDVDLTYEVDGRFRLQGGVAFSVATSGATAWVMGGAASLSNVQDTD